MRIHYNEHSPDLIKSLLEMGHLKEARDLAWDEYQLMIRQIRYRANEPVSYP